ncbi:MAG: tRNA dihydrouridine synthase DusB [Treponemataceae bacterium]|nr:tRNA dihydrouridine synthase DusB [Treponemataceae bacterium]
MKQLYHPVKIGSVDIGGNLFLAPVAGYSDRAFRSICRSCGADFTYTEMVSAEALVRGSEKTAELMKRAENESVYAVQIFGGNPETIAEAVKIVKKNAFPDVIDINAGCPVPKIIKSGSGSALTKEPDKLFQIVKAAAAAAEETPVTVKIRSGWDNAHLTWKEAALAAEEAGASAITLHARTKAQGYEGKADWNLLRLLVETLKGRIPVFGSGDVFTPQDAKRMLEETGCDAVMFARGAMGNPFVFTKTKAFLQGGEIPVIPVEFRMKTAFQELHMLIADKGEAVACREMRKRFCCYSKGIPGAAVIRQSIVAAKTEKDYEIVVDKLLSAFIAEKE